MRHAETAVQAGPAVAGAVVHALADGSAFCEAVGQIHLLVVDGNLSRRLQTSLSKFKPHRGKYRFAFVVFLQRERERGKAHLSYTPLEHFADVCRLRQEFHVGDSSQVHGGVDVEALGFSWGRLPLHWALVHPQVAGPLVSLSHDSVPLAQSDGLWTAKDGLAWKPKKQTQRFNLYLFCSSLSVNLSLSYTRYYLKHIQ